MPLGLPQIRPVDPLTSYGLNYYQSREDFAADAAFPWLITSGDTGTYYIPDARNTLRAEDARWGWNSGPPRIQMQYGSAAFKAQKYGFKDVVSDDDRRNWLNGSVGLDNDMTETLTEKLLMAREVRCEALIDAGTYGTTSVASGTAQWNDTAANPRLNVRAAMIAIKKKIGRLGNTVIIPGGVWDVVVGTQSTGTAGWVIQQMITYTGEGGIREITPQLIARYFNVDLVKPATAIQSDTSKHVTRTVIAGLPEAGTYIWDQKEVYVMYNTPNPGPRSNNFGVSFGPLQYDVKRGRDEEVEGDTIRVKQVVDEKEVSAAAMNVLTTVIA
jgi:hypothetical protein